MKWLVATCLLAAAMAGHAQTMRVPFATDDENFSADDLVRGVAASAQQCVKVANAVWAQAPDGPAECIRFWVAGFTAGTLVPRVLVYFPPDQMAFDQPDAAYVKRNPKVMQSLVDGMQARAGVPFILLSRPGIFGSSGEHKQRRRELESRLMSVALDEIKITAEKSAWIEEALAAIR